MDCGTRAKINLTALQHNFQQVRQLAPNSKIMAMIKGNAYGHGLVKIAQALPQADAFGVACLGEALLLRQAGVNNRIVSMRGFSNREELSQAIKHNLDIVVHTTEQVELLETSSLPMPITVWLKIDSGMHRLGFHSSEFAAIYQRLTKCHINKPLCLISHFADADDLNKSTTNEQLKLFNELVADLAGPKTIANSAGIVAWPESHQDWVRPGIMLYGVSPILNKTSLELNLQPVMTLKSRLVAVRQAYKGERIGYGGSWQCSDNRLIGVAAIGYGDGYPHHAKNGTPILVNGVQCCLVGRVSMDMITIDLTNYPQAKIGDEITLWGEGLPIEQIAHAADTIGYELLCNVSRRVAFEYLS